MIIKTTPEIAEALFEHLLILNVSNFQILVTKHNILNEKVKTYFILEKFDTNINSKIDTLIRAYNELIENQTTEIIEEIHEETQNFWTPVKDFKLKVIEEKFDRNYFYLSKKIGFGIGLHPSTVLTLRGIQEKFDKNNYENFVDVGSGSGILSMYAYFRDVKKIFAYEIQKEARETMLDNFRINKMDTFSIFFNEKEDNSTLYAANMRPKELEACKSIFKNSENLVLGGLLQNEDFFISHKIPKEIMKFCEWKGYIF